MISVFKVCNWDKFFEGAKSKTYNNKTTCSMPNKHGLGYRKIIRSENGTAVFGAWCALIQILSRHEKPRQGYCTETGKVHGNPYSPADLEILTAIPANFFTSLFPIAESVGWLEVIDAKDTARIPLSPQYPLNSDSDSDSDSDSSGDDGYIFIKKCEKLSSISRERFLQIKRMFPKADPFAVSKIASLHATAPDFEVRIPDRFLIHEFQVAESKESEIEDKSKSKWSHIPYVDPADPHGLKKRGVTK